MNNPPLERKMNYIVASVCDSNLWFYGAGDDEDEAYEVAEMIGGVVIENPVKFM